MPCRTSRYIPTCSSTTETPLYPPKVRVARLFPCSNCTVRCSRRVSSALMLPAAAPGRGDANEYFEGIPVVQPPTIPQTSVYCAQAWNMAAVKPVNRTIPSQSFRDEPRHCVCGCVMHVCARRCQSHLVMSGG